MFKQFLKFIAQLTENWAGNTSASHQSQASVLEEPEILQDYTLQVISLTDQGGRSNNEDYQGVRQYSPQSVLCVTADGLGGYAGGELASQIAVETIMSYMDQHFHDPSPATILRESFEQANEAIIQKTLADPHIERMRTTAVALMIREGKAYWAHVGDSRLYHIRNEQILSQTQDHSVVQLLVNTGEIQPSEMRGHPDRNRLIKVMGSHDEFRVAYQSSGVPIQNGDYFVLCSDGFWDLITEDALMEALLNAESIEIANQLLEAAQSQGEGNYDNITLQIVHVTKQAMDF